MISPTDEEIEQALTDARQTVRHDWTQGAYSRVIGGRTRYCAVGAIRRSTDSRLVRRQVERLLWEAICTNDRRYQKYLNPYPNPDGHRIEGWNDSAMTGHRKVMAAFNEAIDNLHWQNSIFGQKPSRLVRRAYERAVRETEQADARARVEAERQRFVIYVKALPHADVVHVTDDAYVPPGPTPNVPKSAGTERPTGPCPKDDVLVKLCN